MMPLGCLPGEVILVYTVLYFWEGNQRQTLNSMKKLDFSTGLGTPLDPGETGESGWGEESLDFPAASAGSMTLTWISNWRWDRKRQDEIHEVNFGFTWSQRYDEQTEQSAHWHFDNLLTPRWLLTSSLIQVLWGDEAWCGLLYLTFGLGLCYIQGLQDTAKPAATLFRDHTNRNRLGHVEDVEGVDPRSDGCHNNIL